MFNEYEEFLTKKAYKIENVGFDTDDVHPMLFPFQQAVVKWAAKKGRRLARM